METRKFDQIVAFKKGNGAAVAFHSQNLEVAQISDELWHAMRDPQLATSELAEDLAQWSESINSDVKNGNLKFGIKSLTLNVTQICNLHCTYCAAGGDGTYGDPQKKISIEKTLPQIEFYISKLNPGEEFYISFLGGEPLLYPEALAAIGDYAKQVAQSKGASVKFGVTTNGTLITSKTLEVLRQLKAHVAISLDGPPETNDKARPNKSGKGVTNQVIEGLRLLSQAKNDLGQLGISAVFDHNNLAVLLAYNFFTEFDVDWYEFNFTHENGDRESSRIFSEQMEQVAALAYSRGGEKELRKIKLFGAYFKQLDNQQRIENFCGAGKTSLVIDAKNKVYTCPWLVTDSQEQVGDGLYLSEKRLDSYQPALIEANDCQKCWARYVCGGGCMAINKSANGEKNRKDPIFCERTRFLISLALNYYLLCRT